MYRLESDAASSREIVLDDIFRCRIQLLLLMSIDYLKDAPLGDFQRKAMEKNAIHIETECYSGINIVARTRAHYQFCVDDVLSHHLKLLAILVKTAAKGYSMSMGRKASMLTHVEAITEMLDEGDEENHCLLKVA